LTGGFPPHLPKNIAKIFPLVTLETTSLTANLVFIATLAQIGMRHA
jgi:hypothetical protein